MGTNVKRVNTQKTGFGNRATAYYTESSLRTGKRSATDSKFGNKKTEVDGIIFASKHEATRYIELKYMERAGLIKNLKLQERYELIPKVKKLDGKIQRPIHYVADFCYLEKTKGGWNKVVEDAKGCRTDVYRLKKKLMLWKYGIEVREV